jgi:hypothetical protein
MTQQYPVAYDPFYGWFFLDEADGLSLKSDYYESEEMARQAWEEYVCFYSEE